MNIPLSWLKDYVDIDLSLENLARTLTMAGLEVDAIHLVGLQMPAGERQEFKVDGLSWDRERIVVAQIDEVMPHPNADRLVLCRLKDGLQEHVVLTGAPNLYPYKGQGPLAEPLKVAYAKEGARIYDGHQPGQVLTTLKPTKIRGVESYSMVCSAKELGLSDEHEGVIILSPDAPTGTPLADYMGDAVFEISILPNMIRNACILGVAREVAALTGKKMRKPLLVVPASGKGIQGTVTIQITRPEMNPRFVVGLVRGVEPRPSPAVIQQRLRLAGMRPINSIVDATNYVMLETGQPLHAFDYDVLVQRAGSRPPVVLTRAARPQERLTTLDGVERTLDDFTTLVCDTAGALSIAGVMGGQESEVTDATRTVLLEGAAWNFINVRKTVQAQRLSSEAAYRFSRGIHPELCPQAVSLCLGYMAQWGGGEVAAGLVDEYPAPVIDPEVTITPADVKRLLGIDLKAAQIAGLLEGLEFKCRVDGEYVSAQTPPFRLDIGQGEAGKADLLEEVARLYGYDRIPARRLADELPPQRSNPSLEGEERVRDILVSLGLQEVITYRFTAPEREARLLPPGAGGDPVYVRLRNPSTPERSVMRRSLLASVLEVVERNARLAGGMALFEVGNVFLPQVNRILPDEPRRLALVLTGQQDLPAWDRQAAAVADFFDLKGILEALMRELHLEDVAYEPAAEPTFHPGKCAVLRSGETRLGVMGELHPLIAEQFGLGSVVAAAELDLDAVLACVPARFESRLVPAFPPVLEDIAVVLEEDIPAANVMAVIRQTGGKILEDVCLFDIYRGERIGTGKKSLAFSLTYQADDRTLTDQEAAQVRQRIIKRLEQELGAKLRS